MKLIFCYKNFKVVEISSILFKIRLEESTGNEKWFHSCVDLVQTRFIEEEFKHFGIKEIKINKVTKIHNKFLKNRFDDKTEIY